MSELNSTRKCQCILGYSGSSVCIRNIFTASVSVGQDNLVTLVFSEPLRYAMKNSQVVTVLYGTSLNFIICTINLSKITLNITFVSEITANSQLIIQFTGEIVSESNSILNKSNLTAALFMSDEYTQNQLIQAKINAAAQLGKTGAIAGTSAAIGASLLGYNPSGIFNYLNTAEIFYTIYLFNIEFYPAFDAFLSNSIPQSTISDPFAYVIDPNEGIQMSSKYQSYGSNTNLVLLNAGKNLGAFVLFMLVFIIALLLNYTRCLKAKAKKLLYYYKFGFFLRFWLLTFLRNVMSCYIGIKYSKLENNTQIADFSLSILLSVIYK